MVARGARPGSGARHDWDGLSKVGVRRALVRILQLLGHDIDEAELVAAPVDLPGTAHRADLVLLISGRCVVHVEIQQRPDPEMPRRMLEYAVRLFAMYPYAMASGGLIQILVQVTGEPMPDGLRNDVLDYGYRLLHVPTTPAHELLSDPGLAPFAAVQGNPALAGPIIESILSDPDVSEQTTLLTLALHLDAEGTLKEYLRRYSMTDVFDTVYARLRDTPVAERLLEEGIEQGIEQGIDEGVLVAVTDILTARFAAAAPDEVMRFARQLVAENGRHAARAALSAQRLPS